MFYLECIEVVGAKPKTAESESAHSEKSTARLDLEWRKRKKSGARSKMAHQIPLFLFSSPPFSLLLSSCRFKRIVRRFL